MILLANKLNRCIIECWITNFLFQITNPDFSFMPIQFGWILSVKMLIAVGQTVNMTWICLSRYSVLLGSDIRYRCVSSVGCPGFCNCSTYWNAKFRHNSLLFCITFDSWNFRMSQFFDLIKMHLNTIEGEKFKLKIISMYKWHSLLIYTQLDFRFFRK